MKKVIAVFIMVILFASITILAEGNEDKQKEKILNSLEKKGISKERIRNITNLPPSEWHERINALGIDNTSINIQEVEIEGDRPVFAISASGNNNVQTEKETVMYSRSFLSFGLSDAKISGFMKTSTGTMSGLNKGYVMARGGSITGVTTSLEVNENNNEDIEVIILKNGEEIGFGNRVSSSVGAEKDFDSISKDTIEFSAGDVISAYVKTNSRVSDLNTLVEITSKS